MPDREEPTELRFSPREDEEPGYYDDPHIEFLLEGDGATMDDQNYGRIAGGPIKEAGYYIFTHCDLACCGVCGPFPDVVAAREYSRRELANDANWFEAWHREMTLKKPTQPSR